MCGSARWIDFAVEFEHEAQHAVRCRVLRAEVERVVLNLCHGVLLVFQTAMREVFADHARRDFPRPDRHRLIDDALSSGSQRIST